MLKERRKLAEAKGKGKGKGKGQTMATLMAIPPNGEGGRATRHMKTAPVWKLAILTAAVLLSSHLRLFQCFPCKFEMNFQEEFFGPCCGSMLYLQTILIHFHVLDSAKLAPGAQWLSRLPVL